MSLHYPSAAAFAAAFTALVWFEREFQPAANAPRFAVFLGLFAAVFAVWWVSPLPETSS